MRIAILYFRNLLLSIKRDFRNSLLLSVITRLPIDRVQRVTLYVSYIFVFSNRILILYNNKIYACKKC